MTPRALKLKAALEKETGKMVCFRSRKTYNASQRRLQKQRRDGTRTADRPHTL